MPDPKIRWLLSCPRISASSEVPRATDLTLTPLLLTLSMKARLANVLLVCISLNLLLCFRLQKACDTVVKTFSLV